VTGAAYPPPAIAISPLSEDFGYIQIGTTANRTFYVTNSGGGTLTGTASVSAPYTVTSGASYSLGEGSSQAVVVQYSPTAVGTNNNTVSFTGGSGATASVAGAAYPPPAIAVTPTSLDFRYLLVDGTRDLSLYVTNTGGGRLIGSATATAPYSILSGADYDLGTKQGQTVVVRYNPTSAGTNLSQVLLSGGGGASVSLRGVAVESGVNTPPELPQQPDQTVNELTALVVTNTATDNDLPPNVLTYELVGAPSGATIDSEGVIHWTPTEAEGPGNYTITTVVKDDSLLDPLSATNSFKVTVLEVNQAPVLPAQADRTINEGTALVVVNTASDPDIPANPLTYHLLGAPAGATIDSNGVIRWTPSSAQSGNSYVITTIVNDNGTPNLTMRNSFTVTVQDVNNAPVLPAQNNQTIAELTTLRVVNTATDSDVPADHLVYVLTSAPQGASIDATGVITWTPDESQGPGTNQFTTVVTDDGTPPRSATNTFEVVVTEVNTAPVLPEQVDRTMTVLEQLTVTNTATDADIPANSLSYQLIDPPAGAAINANGVITWTPGDAQGPSTNLFTTVVLDNGVPALAATNTFNVVVNRPLLPPDVAIALPSTNGMVITIDGQTGVDYTVLGSTNLSDWFPLAVYTNVTTVPFEYTDTNAVSGTLFYRVRVSVP
jgi:hypothetical protein